MSPEENKKAVQYQRLDQLMTKQEQRKGVYRCAYARTLIYRVINEFKQAEQDRK